MKKRGLSVIVLCLLLAASMGLMGGCESKPAEQVPGTGVTPASTIFVSGTSGNLILGLNPIDAVVSSITEGGAELDASNYTVADGSITLKSGYLSSLGTGTHTFTITVDGRSVKVDVRCYKAPVFSAQTVDYIWDEPQDFVVPVDLGGDGIVSVKIGNERLSADAFSVSDGNFIISKDSIESTCIDGENVLTLTTNVGVAELIINCHNKVIRATFDNKRYKIQEVNGKDVSFAFNPGGAEFALKIKNGGEYALFDNGGYEYNALTKTLNIKAAWLDEKYADIHAFRLEVEDSESTEIDFEVGSCGKAGSAKLAVAGSMYAMNDFDTIAPDSSFGGGNVNTDLFFTNPDGAESKIVTGEQAISGNSLLVTSKVSGVGWNTLFGMNMPFKQNVLYRFDMKVKMTTVAAGANPSLAFRFMPSPEVFGLLIDYNAESDSFILSKKSDDRTVFEYDKSTKILSVSVYMTPGASGENFMFTAINADKASFAIDDLKVLATDIPASLKTTLDSVEYMKHSGEDLEIDLSATGVKFAGNVTLGEVALAQGNGYVMTNKGFAVKADFLAKIADGEHVLAFEGYYVKDIFGTTEETECSAVITINSVAPAKVNGAALKVQSAAKEDLAYSLSLGNFTLESITTGGVPVASQNYTLSDGNLTLKKEYLNTLKVGLHRFTLNFVYDDKTMQLTVSAGVYGSESAHLADVVGIMDFGAYNIGTSLGGIIPPKDGASSADGYIHSWGENYANKTVISDDVMGKALLIPESEALPGFLSYNTLKTDTVYVVRIKFRTANDAAVSSLLIKWNNSGVDASWIEGNKIKNDTKDYRTTIERDANNVYTWTSYLPKTAVTNDQLILWPVVPQELHIGSIEVIETDLDSANQPYTPYNYADYTDTGAFKNDSTVEYSGSGDLYIIQHTNDEGGKFNEFWLEYNGVKLVKDVDYVMSGYTVTLKEAFLKTLPSGTTALTVCRGKTGVTDMFGELYAGSQTATVNIAVQ